MRSWVERVGPWVVYVSIVLNAVVIDVILLANQCRIVDIAILEPGLIELYGVDLRE